MRLILSVRAKKYLDKLPRKQFVQVGRKLFALETEPRPHDSEDLKGLDFKRVDIGEHRIIYKIVEDIIEVALIGPRNDDEVYKRLRQR